MALKSYFSLFHYNEAYPDVQAEELYLNGELIDRYRIDDKVVALYSYHNFYIEVTSNPISREIETYLAISVDKAADKYVKSIMA